MKNGLYCVYCDKELHDKAQTMFPHCSGKLKLVRKLLSMRLPLEEEPEKVQSECVYCVDGICANAYNPMYAQPCNADLLCKRGVDNG